MDRVLPTSVQQNFILAQGLTSNGYNVPTDLPIGIYRAYVRARRPDTQGDFSFALEFFVGGRPVVNVLGSTTDTTPTFSWGRVDGASGYEIFVQRNNPAPNEAPILRQSNIGTTSFTLPSALGKGTYRVWIRAINAATGGFSLWSEGASTTFIIVDASDADSGSSVGLTDFVLTTAPENLLETSTESSISMLPSVVSGSVYQPVVRDVFAQAEMQAVVKAIDSAESVVKTVDDGKAAAQSDEVLSNWDEQLWWDQAQQAPAVHHAGHDHRCWPRPQRPGRSHHSLCDRRRREHSRNPDV
jgi:hypothetical protein